MSNVEILPEQSEKLLRWITDDSTFAVLQGDTGVGKTYVGLALFDYIFQKKLSRGVFYPSVFCYPEGQIFEIISDSWKTPGMSEKEEIAKITEIEFLFLDDLGSCLSRMEWKDSILFRIIDERSIKHKKTFITTNLSPQQILQTYHPRFLDRFYNSKSHWICWEGESKR